MTESAGPYAFILNPSSGNGRAGRQWNALKSRVRDRLGEFEVYATDRPGHATDLASQAIRDGARRIFSCGGDGTHFEVLNGFFEDGAPIAPDAELGVFPLGTGSDLPRTLNIPRNAAKAIAFLDSKRVVLSDVGKITARDRETGQECTCYFLSSCHVGFGGEICDYVNNHSKALGGRMTFLMALLAVGASFKPVQMSIQCDDRSIDTHLVEIVAANGQWDGGGMHVAPYARLNSGEFEVYSIPELGPLQSLLNIPRLYRGTQDRHPAIDRFTSRAVTVDCDPPVMAAVDGEIAGVTPLTVEIVPNAVRLVTGPDPPVV